MMPGPTLILACPHCKGLVQLKALMSGNTFHARLWTDGRLFAPMLPMPSEVSRCPFCQECYWLADTEEIGRVEWYAEDFPPEWEDAGKIVEPTVKEYFHALEQGLARNADQERELRVLIWWKGNDRFRTIPAEETYEISEISEPERKNIEALLRLLKKGDDYEGMIKAEILREFGKFKAAELVLNRILSQDYDPVIFVQRSLLLKEDACVRQIYSK